MGNVHVNAFSTSSDGKAAAPFLKWPGGKQWLAARLAGLIPTNTEFTYFEPFLGGASLFFAARPRRAVLGDINPRLIETYVAVRDRPNQVIRYLTGWQNTKENFYEIRGDRYRGFIKRAAQFIYLNKTCWNGLYRVNREGEFNVPYGHHDRTVFEREQLRDGSSILASAKLICADFDRALKTATAGDFVYLDPPYTVLHSDNGFRRYNEKLFSWEDQERLAETATELIRRGCRVVVSNAAHSKVAALYPAFAKYRVQRMSLLAADSSHRCSTREALFSSFEIPSSVLTR
jgi:DNA adenine methylase